MIVRTYVVKMPTSSPAVPLDILVTNAPGSQAAPTVVADAAYYEVLNRPFRTPVLAAAGQAAGFVPWTRLGFSIAVTPLKAGVVTTLPGAQLSASLAALSSTDAGPSISVPTFADPAGGPSLRLTGSAGTAGGLFMVSMFVAEAKDTDQSGTNR
jgi:hypothetical protein